MVLPPYRQISQPAGQLPDYQRLGAPSLSEDLQAKFTYLPNWQRNFDFVLLMDAGGAPDLEHFLPGRLHLAQATDMTALFRITPP